MAAFKFSENCEKTLHPQTPTLKHSPDRSGYPFVAAVKAATKDRSG